MPTFLKVPHLTSAICTLISEAQKEVVIVSPFLALHEHYKMALSELKTRNIKLTVLYGKTSMTGDYRLSDHDLEFLRSFNNIDILYNARLHAKYYGNESSFISTSLNMNYTSHNNNYEYGIQFNLDNNSDEIKQLVLEIRSYLEYIKESSKVIFSTSGHQTEYDKRLSEIKAKFPNAYERWTEEDDELLERKFCEKETVEQLSKYFKRQPSAIRSRINKLELYEKYP